jgi:GNAT superfamily N-acetyltransferase
MNFTIIDINNINIIYDFLKTTSSKHFRYYNKRKPEDVINNHLYTIIGTVENQPVCYGHIDFCNNKYWLGLCVSDNKLNQKYGTTILNKLLDWCENNTNTVYLSVDIDNEIAIHLYNKNGFNIEEYKNNIIFMKKITSKSNIIKLDTSFGEALDKLSILEIKLENINDERKNDVQNEYNILYKQLKNIFNDDINYFYYILKSINNNIWILQDKYRLSKDIDERNKLCDDIIKENDRRFRVKSKINNFLNSTIKEQKGYIKKKAFILIHLGLGDMVNCIGLVRYLSTVYDELLVVCRKVYYENIKMLYENDKTIKFYLCDDFQDISPKIERNIEKFNKVADGYDLYLCGMHKLYDIVSKSCEKLSEIFNIIPFCFYEDCGLSPTIYREYSFIPRIYESIKLYNEVKNICEKYVVIHKNCSLGIMFELDEIVKNIDINQTLVINIDKNIYEKGHKYYEISEKCVLRPILYYVDLIENSCMNILSDSCMFCLALQLNIKNNYNYYVGRHIYDHFFYEKYGYDRKKHPLFTITKQLKTVNIN